MDLRTLSFFLAVAEERSIKKAAEKLHKTQPNVTRSIHALEQELGATLFVRSTKGTLLTEEGRFFRDRAEEILLLVKKSQEEFAAFKCEELRGKIVLSAGESEGMRNLVKIMAEFKRKYPKIEFSILSGNGKVVAQEISNGLSDLGIVFEPFDLTPYHSLELPWIEEWAVLMRKDDPLASYDRIIAKMLYERPLLISEQTQTAKKLWTWMGKTPEELNVFAYYSLANTPKLMVEEGLGLMLMFDRLLELGPQSSLTTRPLSPSLTAKTFLIWKKDKILSKAAAGFLKFLKDETNSEPPLALSSSLN